MKWYWYVIIVIVGLYIIFNTWVNGALSGAKAGYCSVCGDETCGTSACNVCKNANVCVG